MTDCSTAPGPADWFLSRSERGNPASDLDRKPPESEAWTSGNTVTVHVDGASYFARLHDALAATTARHRIWFTDWEGNADERLAGQGTEVGLVLARAAERGVEVRGLLWRSHPRQAHFDEQDNMHLARDLNEDGGTLALDERVRRGGSHHQKLAVIGDIAPGATDDVAFAG